ncbi:hypothetical protein QQS21_010593 [Conoideocrella luteorostrata]|uniref:Uncharacterized protein n=1 Tax=Conoideocrella luteorostrata TaxID=1105319 RepID=A0AAJ0CH13_9HYPO|nr:hypothetical protein QQS21_010593 [Conoideocrella luteorostrata]
MGIVSVVGASSLVLSLAASASIVKGNVLEPRQSFRSPQWFRPGVHCYKREESCLGTEVWCAKPEYYKDIDKYPSQQACFDARIERTEWRYINTDCLADLETCDGTDVVCSRIEDWAIRASCYAARPKGKWFPKYSPGCLAAGREVDERCVGTDEFCKGEARVKLYGSAEACLGRREAATKENKKQGFLIKNALKCYGDPTEECQGTEDFCFRATAPKRHQEPAQVLACVESRVRPPLYAANSPDCDTSKQNHVFSEACVGTNIWCASQARVKIYGSKERCEAFRQPYSAGPGKWVPPQQACRDNLDQSEQCKGTEQICQWQSLDRNSCYGARETAPFLLPEQPNGCPPTKPQVESCVGTDSWCYKGYNEMNYLSQGECFSRRGFKHDELVARVVKKMGDMMTETILKHGEKVIKDALYYDLVGKRGDENSAKASVNNYVNQYLEKLEKETLPEATEKFMTNVQKAAVARHR